MSNPELTDEAREEIRKAIEIVREDRILKYMRENRNASPNGPPNTDPVVDPSVVDSNKPIPPPVKPPEPPKSMKRGLYWGDMNDE